MFEGLKKSLSCLPKGCKKKLPIADGTSTPKSGTMSRQRSTDMNESPGDLTCKVVSVSNLAEALAQDRETPIDFSATTVSNDAEVNNDTVTPVRGSSEIRAQQKTPPLAISEVLHRVDEISEEDTNSFEEVPANVTLPSRAMSSQSAIQLGDRSSVRLIRDRFERASVTSSLRKVRLQKSVPRMDQRKESPFRRSNTSLISTSPVVPRAIHQSNGGSQNNSLHYPTTPKTPRFTPKQQQHVDENNPVFNPTASSTPAPGSVTMRQAQNSFERRPSIRESSMQEKRRSLQADLGDYFFGASDGGIAQQRTMSTDYCLTPTATTLDQSEGMAYMMRRINELESRIGDSTSAYKSSFVSPCTPLSEAGSRYNPFDSEASQIQNAKMKQLEQQLLKEFVKNEKLREESELKLLKAKSDLERKMVEVNSLQERLQEQEERVAEADRAISLMNSKEVVEMQNVLLRQDRTIEEHRNELQLKDSHLNKLKSNLAIVEQEKEHLAKQLKEKTNAFMSLENHIQETRKERSKSVQQSCSSCSPTFPDENQLMADAQPRGVRGRFQSLKARSTDLSNTASFGRSLGSSQMLCKSSLSNTGSVTDECSEQLSRFLREQDHSLSKVQSISKSVIYAIEKLEMNQIPDVTKLFGVNAKLSHSDDEAEKEVELSKKFSSDEAYRLTLKQKEQMQDVMKSLEDIRKKLSTMIVEKLDATRGDMPADNACRTQ